MEKFPESPDEKPQENDKEPGESFATEKNLSEPSPNTGWRHYMERTKNSPPRPHLAQAMEYANRRKAALDLGSGALNDSIFLIKEGFEKVIAVDKEQAPAGITSMLPDGRFDYVNSPFESFDFQPGAFDLINAHYSLPFIDPDRFDEVFKKILGSLAEGGIIVGQLAGNRDGWSSNPNITCHTKEEVRSLLAEVKISLLEEDEHDGPTAAGRMKHWHLFHFIARK